MAERLRPEADARSGGEPKAAPRYPAESGLNRPERNVPVDQTPAAVSAPAPQPNLWRNRNLLTLVGGQWVSQVGNTLFQMAVYWTVLQDTGSRSDLGFTGSILAIASVFGLVAGALVDRWDRRKTMIWVDLVRTVLAFGLVGAAVTHHLPVVVLVGVVFVMTLGSQLFYPAEGALLPSVVAPDELTGANSLNQSATALAQLIGSSLGGIVLGLLGPVLLFGFNGVSFAVSVVSLVLLRLSSPPPPVRSDGAGLGAAAGALWRDIVQGQRTILKSPFLRSALPIVVAVNFALAPINFLDVAWVRQVLHLGAFVYGLFGVAIVVGLLVGSVATPMIAPRLNLRTAIIITMLTAGAAVFVLSRIPVAAPDLVCLFVFGLVVAVVNTMSNAAIQRAVPDEVMGRVFGTMSAASNLATPLGGFLTGIGAAVLPIGTLFAAAGVLLAACALLVVGMPTTIEAVEIAA